MHITKDVYVAALDMILCHLMLLMLCLADDQLQVAVHVNELVR